MNRKFDNLYLGLISGIFLPALVLISIFYIYNNNYSLTSYLEYLHSVKALSKTISLCVIANLLLFFIFIWTNNDNSAKGVIGSTVLWGLIIVILKFVV